MARRFRDRCLQVWAATAVGMIHAFDPEIVIFGGGVMESADLIIPFVQTHVNADIPGRHGERRRFARRSSAMMRVCWGRCRC